MAGLGYNDPGNEKKRGGSPEEREVCELPAWPYPLKAAADEKRPIYTASLGHFWEQGKKAITLLISFLEIKIIVHVIKRTHCGYYGLDKNNSIEAVLVQQLNRC